MTGQQSPLPTFAGRLHRPVPLLLHNDPMSAGWHDDKLLRPLEWPLRIIAVVLALISGTTIYSEFSVPHPKWQLIAAALLFGFWFGYLGITGRRPGK